MGLTCPVTIVRQVAGNGKIRVAGIGGFHCFFQAAALVVLFGFSVLRLLAYLEYTDQPPVPILTKPLRAGHTKSKEAQ